MKYYTKKWYELMQSFGYSEGIKTIEDKKYGEEEIKQICEREYDKQLKEFIKEEEEVYNEPPVNYYELIGDEDFNYKDVIIVNEENNYVYEPKSKKEAIMLMEEEYKTELINYKNRPKFNEYAIKKDFEEMYRNLLKNSKEYFPDFVSQNVDVRFLALRLMPKSIYNKLTEYENNNRKEYEKIEKLAEKELNNQNIPEDILKLFCGLHDSIIQKIVKDKNNIVLLVETEEGKTIKLKFEKGQFTENELEEYLKKENNDDIYCYWLYHELYKTDNKYELHILVELNGELRYITIRCEKIIGE